MSEPWTIADLCERVATALADDDVPDSGRVRAVPDERAVRYYATLGLLDRPAMRGRTAHYSPRHLAQIVAIKRMQAQGKSLAEIQRELPTLDDGALTTWSGVALAAPPPRPTPRTSFWRTAPSTAQEPGPAAPPSLVAPAVRIELELGDGLRVSFPPGRPVTDDDILALRIASAPLLAELIRRALV